MCFAYRCVCAIRMCLAKGYGYLAFFGLNGLRHCRVLDNSFGHLISITQRFYIKILNVFLMKKDCTWGIKKKILKLSMHGTKENNIRVKFVIKKILL